MFFSRKRVAPKSAKFLILTDWTKNTSRSESEYVFVNADHIVEFAKSTVDKEKTVIYTVGANAPVEVWETPAEILGKIERL